ncbi:imidazole glycerol phosphate synthase subunit HisH [bacterium]|nr:imidazole glycerol phosphate synthase subunit HisH [bacterium]
MELQAIQIINTGVANIRSLQAAFTRLGRPWQLTVDPNMIGDADTVVLPGVGTFNAAIEAIDQKNLRQAIIDRIGADKRTLAICLGLQVLCGSSDECIEAKGLGILPNRVTRFSDRVTVPQLGWNRVYSDSSSAFEPGEAYFANSFRLADEPEGWNFAKTNYDGEFYSSFWRSKVLACQFHPELSGAWGQNLLKNWLGDSLC